MYLSTNPASTNKVPQINLKILKPNVNSVKFISHKSKIATLPHSLAIMHIWKLVNSQKTKKKNNERKLWTAAKYHDKKA